jgi:CDP-diacylglycerol--glycerol-3-phosphate 3-phosphatidyltransferase
MFGASIGRAAQRIIDAIVRWLALGHINPNILTVIGVSLNVGCGLLFGLGWFFSAGIALIVANLFDMLGRAGGRLSGRCHAIWRVSRLVFGPAVGHGRYLWA